MKDEGYDVLRLIGRGRSCYVSSEYVRGRPMIRWLKYHPNFSKKQLFAWICEITEQLEYIHRCRGNPCYKYVNPYSIIVTEQRELYFLDMGARSNEKMMPVMERRSVRELFLPPEEAYYQTESISLDIYGLGKTIQYLLSVSLPEPSLTKREELRFQKIISRCLGRHSKWAYHHVSEIRRQIPVYHEPQKHFTKRKKALFLAAAFIFAAAGTAAVLAVSSGGASPQRRETVQEGETPQESGAALEDEVPHKGAASLQEEEPEVSADLKKELGFLYFLDKKDYAKSKQYFSEASETQTAWKQAVKGLSELSGYMIEGDIPLNAGKLQALLNEIREYVPEDEDKYYYYRCLIEGYRLLDNREAAQAVLRLGDECMEEADEEVRQKLTGYMAAAYEMNGEPGKAAEKYMDMLSWETRDNSREELYKKLVSLWEEQGENDKAADICRQGIEELKDSAQLRLMHIRMQCGDGGVEREICAQTIQKYVVEMPEITQEQEFQKLANEYGIVMEGDNVWVGR